MEIDNSNIGVVPDAYIAQNLDNAIRYNSTSGGLFPVIAKHIILQSGIVYGAAFDDKFVVRHMGIERLEDIIRLQESKYVQSTLADCFKRIKKELDVGRLVCFSGTPCQVEGLLNYVGYDYQNLVTIGVVCYGVPSPKLFRKYIEFLQEKYEDKLTGFHFRSKKYGYSSPTVVAEFEKRGKLDSKSAIKSYTKTYFTGINMRPSCYECKVKTEKKRFDFLLGDCWKVSTYEKSLDDNKGTTSLFVYTEKGKRILEEISKQTRIYKVDEKMLLENDCAMIVKCKPRNSKRNLLFEKIDSMPYEQLINMVVQDSLTNKIANVVKPLLYKMGVKDSKLLKFVKKYRVKKNSENL